MTKVETGRRPSKKARALSARLFAVQALYQSVQNKQDLSSVAREFLETRKGMDVEGETMVEPDTELFSEIIRGVDERHKDLEGFVTANIAKDNKNLGLLMHSILLCAASELFFDVKTDPPVIINDYLNVAHGFFESSEIKLLNGVLDGVSKAIRAN